MAQLKETLPHVLVIDDDDRIRDLVSRFLTKNGFCVNTASDTSIAREAMALFDYDLLVVDIMMPGEDGLAFTQNLRNSGKNDIPVLFLTAKGETDDLLAGFESGGDDYLIKPFEPRELVARLLSLLKRRPAQTEATQEFKIGHWEYNDTHKELIDKKSQVALSLTDNEATLLKALAQYAGDTVTRERLSELCDVDPYSRAIDVQVTRLRRKLEKDASNPRLLLTVRGKGYRLLVG